jgi:hypothetical protein
MKKGEFQQNKNLAKCDLAKEAWLRALERLETWKCHKSTLCVQVQFMKRRHRCPSLKSITTTMSTFFPMLLSVHKKSNATNDLLSYGYHQPSVLDGHLHLLNQI